MLKPQSWISLGRLLCPLLNFDITYAIDIELDDKNIAISIFSVEYLLRNRFSKDD